ADSASSSATESRNSAEQSSNSANAAKVSEDNAKTSEMNAAKSADDAKNWASTIDNSNFIKKTGEESQSISGSLIVHNVVIKDMIGDQRLMPFRRDELPFGWYFRNGDNFLLDSPQGRALNSLSANYKNDHRITIKTIDGKQYINVPTAFAPDGRGFFERAVNGANRQVGSTEDDAIRNITGGFSMDGIAGSRAGVIWGGYGPFYENGTNPSIAKYSPTEVGVSAKMGFDLSRATRTGPETTVINVGMTPAIYLGV
ncbi:hypothetical protein ACGH6Q_12325, partial [Gilliamella sp. BG2]|uniref:hypothetical protein n=1 Tax=Gilliamella sp. BG2 TaxID=3351509 RepID=UPI00398591CA